MLKVLSGMLGAGPAGLPFDLRFKRRFLSDSMLRMKVNGMTG